MSFTENRAYKRLHLEDLSARMTEGEGASMVEIDYFPINVSADGLSIFTSRALPLDAIIHLELATKKIPLLVVWCKNKADDPAVFRCGLRRVSNKYEIHDLVKQELSY